MRKLGLFLFVGLAMARGVWAADRFRSYREVFESIASGYRQGPSGPNQTKYEDERLVRETFASFNAEESVFKLAAESQTQIVVSGAVAYAVIEARFYPAGAGKNMLRDKLNNGDFFVVRQDGTAFTLIGRLPRYSSCAAFAGKGGAVRLSCRRSDAPFESNTVGTRTITDSYESEGESLKLTDSKTEQR